jgi:hypothetical protein
MAGDVGRSGADAPSGQSGVRPEPASRLGHSATVPNAETDTCWHLLCRTEGGKVSILKNLDAPTARQAYRKLRPDTKPAKYLRRPKGGVGWSGGLFQVSDSHIRSVDILGPEGVELDPWKGVEPDYFDLGHPRVKDFGPIKLPPEDGRKLASEERAAKSERTGA